MATFIQAKDFTPQFVDHSVLMMMKEKIDGQTIFDFEDRDVLDRDILTLAEIIVNDGVQIAGIDEESNMLLESYIRKLNEPDYEDLDEFKHMFISKFPEGTLCIWDKSLDENLLSNEKKLSLVQVIGIEGNYVKFKYFKSHLIEPKFIHMHGGIDSEELFTIQSIHISDFANKSIMFRYTKDEREEIILDILKSI
jgi:hypothetical protein